MKWSIRNAFFAVPLGLALAGCTATKQTNSSNRHASRPQARSTGRPTVLVADLREPSPESSYGSGASEIRHDVTLVQIREYSRSGTAAFIDARPPDQFASGHIRGALNVPAGQVDSYLPQVEESVSRDQLIIIYCSGPTCGSSDMVYERLAAQGYSNMRVYSDGWTKLASARDLR
ncbi:MAG: rhodanese-like domain-containing protein [Planctomycetes bacterium]|nr:rhodanese-like domain-containing protein [Planctomycetota bacterium]